MKNQLSGNSKPTPSKLNNVGKKCENCNGNCKQKNKFAKIK